MASRVWHRAAEILTIGCGIVALLVILGWFIESPTLTQVLPGFAPMQVNTALCLFLLSVGLHRRLLAKQDPIKNIVATIALAIAALTLSQYVIGVDFGIDNWLVEPFTSDRTSHPGRMAPNTAVAMMLTSVALLARADSTPGRLMPFLLGTTILFLGTASITTSLIEPNLTAGWGHVTRMAAHTSLGFIALGLALCISEQEVARELGLTAILGSLLVATGSLSVWAYSESTELTRLKLIAIERQQSFIYSLENRIENQLRLLENLSFQSSRPEPQDLRKALQAAPNVVQLRVSTRGEPEQLLFDQIGQNFPECMPGRGSISLLDGSGYLQICVTTAHRSSLTVVINLTQMAKDDAEVHLDNLWFALGFSEAGIILQSSFPKSSLYPVIESAHLSAAGLTLDVEVAISESFIRESADGIPVILLISGVILNLLVLSVFLLLRRNRQQLRALSVANGKLRLEINERASAETKLRLAGERLRQSNAYLDDFAYVVSHDLREPLRGINSLVRFTIEDHGEQIPEAARQRLDKIQTLTHHLSSLISDLLLYSRVGRVDDDLQETVDLEVPLESALESLQVLLHEENVTIHREGGALPAVTCSRTRITEVFRNLISNAVIYNNANEKRLVIGHRQESSRGMVIFVRDNGIGISESDREKVFQMFKRLHHQDVYPGGTGAGLTIVRKIIDAHGGKVWAESNPGNEQGTTICFTLPPQDHSAKNPITEHS